MTRLRGVVFRVGSDWDALEMFRELKTMGRRARDEGREREFLQALESRDEELPGGDRDDPLLSSFMKEWLETSVEGSGLTESEIESTTSIAKNHLVPFFGKLRVSQIGPRDLDRFVAHQRRQKHQYGTGYAASTINNHLSVLHRCLAQAVRYGLLDRNPVTGDVWQRIDRTPEDADNWLEPDDEKRLVEWLWTHWKDDPVRWLPLLTQLIAGLRFSELRVLKAGDLVEVPKPGIWIRRSLARHKKGTPKNEHARFQVLPPDLFALIRGRVGKGSEGLLFPAPLGAYLANNSLNRWLREACAAAGVRSISTHGLRHTAGTSYAAMGYGQKAIAALLGHRDTKATERYTHAADRLKAEAVESRWSNVVRLNERRGGS